MRLRSLPPRDRRGWFGALISMAALAAAIGSALATSVGPARQVERLSGGSATILQEIAGALPAGYAFGVGMVAAVNPCGFAMLPAYLAIYLGADETRGTRAGVRRALAVSVVVTLSFVVLFGFAGIVLSAATSAVAAYFPWLGLAVGVLLILVAGRMLAGGAVYTSLADRMADRIGRSAHGSGIWAYAAFGLAYGLVSLGCTLPLFLSVVGSALVVHGFVAGLLEFLLYSLGMGFVLTTLTLTMAAFRQGVLSRTRRLVRYVSPASALLLLFTGAYVVYYWLALGGLLRI